jgi:methylmalonyl-CoA/ethylmalonyl-CoA epimerase
MITGLAHISIAVPDIEAAAKSLQARYGLAVGPRMVNAAQGVRLAYVELGAAKIELIQPTRDDSPVARFLERNPKGGIHHFALAVDSLDGTVASLRDNGVRTLGDGSPQTSVSGDRIAFIHPADFLGALVELEEHNAPSDDR